MIKVSKQSGPNPKSIFCYDFWCQGKSLEVKPEGQSETRTAFFEDQTSQYLRGLLYRIFKKRFLDCDGCWRVSDSTYAVDSKSMLDEVRTFFNDSNEELLNCLESRKDFFSKKKNSEKLSKFIEIIDYLKRNSLSLCFVSYDVSEVI